MGSHVGTVPSCCRIYVWACVTSSDIIPYSLHVASNEYCAARQRTRKREGEFRSIYFIVGDKVWNMDRGTGMRLRKVCPQCSTVIHARRSVCECGHAFTLKREARIIVSSPAKRKRALESLEDTLRRQESNRTRMASMRASETLPHIIIFVPHCQLILIDVQSST